MVLWTNDIIENIFLESADEVQNPDFQETSVDGELYFVWVVHIQYNHF